LFSSAKTSEAPRNLEACWQSHSEVVIELANRKSTVRSISKPAGATLLAS
jgi:hypothetical protein